MLTLEPYPRAYHSSAAPKLSYISCSSPPLPGFGIAIFFAPSLQVLVPRKRFFYRTDGIGNRQDHDPSRGDATGIQLLPPV